MNETRNRQTVLVVDDVRPDAMALKRLLEPEWAVRIAFSGPDALLAATQAPVPDLILLDVQMPDMDGYEVCRRLKKNPGTRSIPVIFISALNDWSCEAQGLTLGAADYIIKPVRAPAARARIRNLLARQRVLTDLALANEQLAHLAAHDHLTGLYNRRMLDDCLAREAARAERYGRPLSVILMDIDRFKTVNDRCGHPAGDAVLKESAARLLRTLRGSDIAGRWGGDEFLVICPETAPDAAAILAERLRKTCSERPFDEAGRVTASFGVAARRNGQAPAELVRSADRAMYLAKLNGRNRVERDADDPGMS